MQILTTRGLVDAYKLEIAEVVSWADKMRAVATEYRLGGELVKRTVHTDDMGFTTKGRDAIDPAALDIRHLVTWGPNSRDLAIECYHAGELVKRSVHIDGCRPIKNQAAGGGLAAA